MANNNIYDIVISEEVARQETGNGADLGAGPTLLLTMDAPEVMAVNSPVQNPINVTSTLQNLPFGWAVVDNSHVIWVRIGTSTAFQAATGSSESETYADTFAGTSPTTPGQQVREYYSELLIYNTSSPLDPPVAVPTSTNAITIETTTTVYVGLLPSSTPPTSITQLSPIIGDSFGLASNASPEYLFVSVPSAEPQPLAIKDENGLISNITEYYPINTAALPGYNIYMYKWPVKLEGGYTHVFTLIYS